MNIEEWKNVAPLKCKTKVAADELRKEGWITSQDYADAMKSSRVNARSALERAVSQGKVERKSLGSAKAGVFYRIKQEVAK